jgi:hypothetical protein
MSQYVGQLGMYGWPMVILSLTNIFLVIWYAVRLFGSEPKTSSDINRIMIIAGLVLAIGFYSHFSGLQSGLAMFGQFSPPMFASGYALSLEALKLGLAVSIWSGVFWFGLRLRLQQVSTQS